MSESKMARVFNLTDVKTPTLEQYGLVSQHIAVGNRMCEPGQFVELEDTGEMRAHLAHLVKVGALSVNEVPPKYAVARATLDSTMGKVSHARVQHLELKETKVMDATEQAPPEVMTDAAPVVEDNSKASKRGK